MTYWIGNFKRKKKIKLKLSDIPILIPIRKLGWFDFSGCRSWPRMTCRLGFRWFHHCSVWQNAQGISCCNQGQDWQVPAFLPFVACFTLWEKKWKKLNQIIFIVIFTATIFANIIIPLYYKSNSARGIIIFKKLTFLLNFPRRRHNKRMQKFIWLETNSTFSQFCFNWLLNTQLILNMKKTIKLKCKLWTRDSCDSCPKDYR